MKELLKTLQAYPRTWERFVKYIGTMGYVRNIFGTICRVGSDLSDYENDALVEKLLTDFCDGEGMIVLVRWEFYDGETWWEYDVIETYYGTYHQPADKINSRQEALNQGVEKSFSLMENKGDK